MHDQPTKDSFDFEDLRWATTRISAVCAQDSADIWDFPKIKGVPHFGVFIIRILLFRVLY